ncbi:MAG: hypothetical protein D3916_06950, partial [Candidatus Electrothrix sp. MAN1_4]|nr:hypothetical protein [Candidatus Electrothrix sp. MAN1_4]
PAIIRVRAMKPVEKEDSTRLGSHRGFSPVRSQDTWNSGAIIFYHRVTDMAADRYGLSVHPDDFRSHMEHLREEYTPIGLNDFVRAAEQGSLPPDAVAVTFDDGYIDNLTTASPILQEFDIPATFFIPTEQLDREHESWWDILDRIFQHDQDIPTECDVYGDKEWILPTESREQQALAHQKIFETIYAMGAKERDQMMARLCNWSTLDLAPRQTHRHMITTEVQQLESIPGHSIGCHTIHHLSLPNHDVDTQLLEIVTSRKELEHALGKPVTTFSYPYGEYDKETLQLLRTTSFDAGVTVEGRTVCFGAEKLLLPRFEMKGYNRKEFSVFMGQVFNKAGY